MNKKKLNQWKSVGDVQGMSCITDMHKYLGLPYGSPNFLGKIEFWAFLCFSLEFSPSESPIFFFNHTTVSAHVAFFNILFSSLTSLFC